MSTTKQLTFKDVLKLNQEDRLTQAHFGNEYAQALLAQTAANNNDSKELMRMALRGWLVAMQLTYFGYKNGSCGFEKDLSKAEELRINWDI